MLHNLCDVSQFTSPPKTTYITYLPYSTLTARTSVTLSRDHANPGRSLPLAFYLRLFGTQISSGERLLDYSLITVSTILSVVGTIWAFLPKSLIGADQVYNQ